MQNLITYGLLSNKYTTVIQELVKGELFFLRGEKNINSLKEELLPLTQNQNIDIIIVDITIFNDSYDIIELVKFIRCILNDTRIIILAPNLINEAIMFYLIAYGVYDIINPDIDLNQSDNMINRKLYEALYFGIENPKMFAQVYQYITINHQENVIQKKTKKEKKKIKKEKHEKIKKTTKSESKKQNIKTITKKNYNLLTVYYTSNFENIILPFLDNDYSFNVIKRKIAHEMPLSIYFRDKIDFVNYDAIFIEYTTYKDILALTQLVYAVSDSMKINVLFDNDEECAAIQNRFKKLNCIYFNGNYKSIKKSIKEPKGLVKIYKNIMNFIFY